MWNVGILEFWIFLIVKDWMEGRTNVCLLNSDEKNQGMVALAEIFI